MSPDALASGNPGAEHRADRGFSLVALMVSITIMLIVLAVMAPGVRRVEQDEREEELLFRGQQIADAIRAYQQKNGNTAPPSLELLVRGRYLRRPYKDPMVKDGKWRLLHPGEPPICADDARAAAGARRGGVFAQPLTTVIGPVIGVASRSPEKGLRTLNGRSRYCEWFFIAGQPPTVLFLGGRARTIQQPRLPRGIAPGTGTASQPSQRYAPPAAGPGPDD